MTRIGGWCLILAAALFIAVFSWLAGAFNYPDVLDQPAATVLPALVKLGPTGRLVWSLYALIPLLLIPAGVGITAGFRRYAPRAAVAATTCAYLAALSMALGLARWPTAMWELGRHWISNGTSQGEGIGTLFDFLNFILGRVIGEFIGEIALNLFFLLTGWVFLKSGRPRWQGIAGIVVALVGFIAALRNITPAVAPIAEANNYLLPLWLIVLGVLLARSRESGGSFVAAPKQPVDDALAVGK